MISKATSKKYVSLSFDDGPNLTGSVMHDMLDVLQKHQVKASFFLIGNKITDDNKSEILRAVKMGCDIQNHSWSHPDAVKENFSKAQIANEFLLCEKAILSITKTPTQFYRPPYISVNASMYDVIPRPFICGHACDDWVSEYSSDELLDKMLTGTQDGVIFLLHTGEANARTVDVVDRAIPILKEQGYDFVTVPELFKLKGVTPAAEKLWTIVS